MNVGTIELQLNDKIIEVLSNTMRPTILWGYIH